MPKRPLPKNIYLRGEIYWARFKVRGTEYRESLLTRSQSAAEKRLKLRIETVQNEVVFGLVGPKSWQEAVVGWDEEKVRAVKPSTFTRYLVSLEQVRSLFDGKMVQEVDDATIRDLVRARQRQGASNATIRRDLTAVSSVLTYAINEGWMSANAALAYSRKRIPETREPIALPTDAAIKMMSDAAPARFADMMAFARETGMREEEIAGLEHGQLDLPSQTVTLHKTKGNRTRTLPLSKKAGAIIARQPRYLSSPFVFWRGDGERHKHVSSRFGDIRRRVAQKAARSKTEFAGFRFHDLRHLFAVEYLKAGKGSIYDLQRLLGHVSIKTTEEYLDFLTPEQVKLAMQGVAQRGAQKRRFAGEKA